MSNQPVVSNIEIARDICKKMCSGSIRPSLEAVAKQIMEQTMLRRLEAVAMAFMIRNEVCPIRPAVRRRPVLTLVR